MNAVYRSLTFILTFILVLSLTACDNKQATQEQNAQENNISIENNIAKSDTETDTAPDTESESYINEFYTSIVLSDSGITVDGQAASSDPNEDIYTANDIVFYLEGQGFTYGEGTAEDEHSQEEADSHTVLHISKAGTYKLSGELSAGQVAIDLGDDAKEDPKAVVTLILDGADITCSVAPAIIFYNIYECGLKDEAVMNIDTSAAGANIIIADGSVNNINGSHVARIYKEYTLNESGTEVVDSKKLHKYDAAFYSKMTMNLDCETEGTGVLNIFADNEGLDSERHLTINGGNININSGNDGINTNEDGISVTTINGGNLNIVVTGTTGEGDGIDSNGWLVINGGTVSASACGFSGDSGIDADNGVYLNGGTIISFGNMFDALNGDQTYAVFTFPQTQRGGTTYTLKDSNGSTVLEITPDNNFMYMVLSDESLLPGEYSLWKVDMQLSAASGNFGNMMDGPRPGGEAPPAGSAPPEKPQGDMQPGMNHGTPPGGFGGGFGSDPESISDVFTIAQGANHFSIVSV